MGKRITVRVSYIVEIDADEWANMNGEIVDAKGRYTIKDLRDNVRRYFLHLAQRAEMLEEASGKIV